MPTRARSSSPIPGYERFWGYVHEFGLAYRYYPRRERMPPMVLGVRLYFEEMLADPARFWPALDLNAREIAYLQTHPFWDFASLYYAPYVSNKSLMSTGPSTRA